MSKGTTPELKRSEVLQGTLDVMVLKALETMGPLHGYGIARRIEQLSEDVLRFERGNSLHFFAAPTAARLDLLGLGRVRE